MIRNFFLTSIRALLKNKSTFFLNVVALTIGVAGCILAYLHINYELSYDRFNSKHSRIFRVVTGDVADGWVKVSSPIPPKLKAEIPEVMSFTRLTKFTYNEKVGVEYNKTTFNEAHFYLADAAIFSIFDIESVRGNLLIDLSKNSVVISRNVASRYFKNAEPIGKIIKVDGRMEFEVAGVFKELPFNSHVDIDFIIPFENLEMVKPGTSLSGNWGQFNYFAYLLLHQDADPLSVESKVRKIVAQYGDDQSMRFENLGFQPLTDIHFQHNRGNIKPSYNPRYLVIYSAVALAILLISFINFINLSVANSTRRIKEVGVRKVLGASRPQLIFQFVTESIITAIIASLLGIILANFTLPFINNMVDSNLTINQFDFVLIGGVLLLILAIALFYGLYIGLFVLSFNPVNAVKGSLKIGNKGKRFKDALMVIQFTISCMLILSSVFIFQQLNFLKNHDIGIDQEGIVTIQLYDQQSQNNVKLLIPELKKLAGVRNVSASRFTPGVVNWHQTVVWEDQNEPISWNIIGVDKNFIETFGIKLVEGDLSGIKELSINQKYSYVINEAALKEAGWDHGLGQVISPFGKSEYSPVAGVARNFNYKSLHNAIEPCVLVITESNSNSQVSVKFSSNDYFNLIAEIETKFIEIIPDTPFEYAFADDQFNNLYKVERQTSQLVGLLTIIAIILALLGVYALLSFTIKERTKEIAIRKVLGIQIKGAIFLLSSNYVRLLLFANALGIPVTWYIMNIWLQNFSYQIDLGFLTFAGVAMVTFFLVFFIVGTKVIQIDRINPTDALRNE